MTENETQPSDVVLVGMTVHDVVQGRYLLSEEERSDDGPSRIEPGAMETTSVDERADAAGCLDENRVSLIQLSIPLRVMAVV